MSLEKFVQKIVPNHCISARSLNSSKIKNPGKIIRSLSIDYINPVYCENIWKVINKKNEIIGRVTSGAFSPDFDTTVALGMIDINYLNDEEDLFTIIGEKKYLTKIHEKPFI